MKLSVVITVTLFWVCSISFGQDFKNDLTSIKTIDDKIQEERFSDDGNEIVVADRLLLKTSIKNVSRKDKQFYSKKEWKKIKKQLLKNKKRISELENGIHTSKVIDTIYFDIPSYDKQSRISGW